ncbi:MAG: PAS domain S-box protein [Gammaproteobacteria bacterium]|nr:PAS domain S-box protein [Gammaproteobacteria bacterium]
MTDNTTSHLLQENTELRKEIRKLKAVASLQERFHEIVNNTTDLVALADRSFNVIYVNAAALKALNYASLTDVMYRHAREFYSKNSFEFIANAALKVVKAHGIWSGEAELIAQDGRAVKVTQVIIAHRDRHGEIEYYSTILHDITEHKIMEENLRKSEQRYTALSSLYPVGIFHIDPTGACAYINPRCSELLGLSLKEALGHGWQKAVHNADLKKITDRFMLMHEKEVPFRLEYRLVHPDGKVIWVHGEIVPQKNDDETVIGYIGTATDITKLRNAEKQLQERQHQLEHLTRLSTIGEMTTSIAHQFNQPLSAIVHYAGGISERFKTEAVADDIKLVITRILEQAERAGKIIHDLRAFLIKGTLQKVPIDINETVLDVISLIADRFEGSGIRMKLNLDEDIPLIAADKLHIEQVILNIVNNAVDAMQDIKPRYRKITIETKASSANSIQILIYNSGPKINCKAVEMLFEPFFTTKENGMGMGLAIAASIMRNHGGYITLKEDPNKYGACFVLTLPIDGDSVECHIAPNK